MSRNLDYKFSKDALLDLEDIWYYTYTQWSLKQADAYTQQILETCHAITQKTVQIRVYADDPTFHLARAGSHYIYFSYEETGILISRILHGSQDPSLHL